MRTRKIFFIKAAVLFFGASVFVSNVLSQTQPPFTLEQMLTAIVQINKHSGATKKEAYIKVLNAIRQRKVTFSLTEESEELLRKEGATDEFIEFIRKNSPSLIHLEAGNNYFNKFDFDRAIEEYTKVFELDPQNVNALVQRGYSLYYRGDSNSSFKDFNSAFNINSNLTSNPSMICLQFGQGKGNIDKAIDGCNVAISANPGFSLFYFFRAGLYRQKMNFDLATKEYEKAKIDFDLAIKDYDKAIYLYPNFYFAYLNRGRSYLDKTEFDKAILDLNKAISLEPAKPFSYYLRGVTNTAKNNFDQAIIDLNKAIEIDPKFADAYSSRAYLYSKRGDENQAIIDYTKAIELEPRKYAPYNNRGVCYFIIKEYEKALKDYNKAIEINPRIPKSYHNRADVYDKLGQKNLAQIDRNKAKELEKSNKQQSSN